MDRHVAQALVRLTQFSLPQNDPATDGGQSSAARVGVARMRYTRAANASSPAHATVMLTLITTGDAHRRQTTSSK
jgi:hypothetical protein